MTTTTDHDPQAVLDYKVDWAPWLQVGEVITASTWTVTLGDVTLTTPAPSHDDTTATVWATGGTPETEAGLTNHVTTNQGRQDDRTIRLWVRNR